MAGKLDSARLIEGLAAAIRRPALALLLAPAVVFAQAPREQVTLPQAIERALKVDPRVVQAAGQVRIASAAERTAFGNYLPRVSANASGNANGALSYGVPQGETDPRWNYRSNSPSVGAGVSVSYPIFTGFRRGAQTEQARAQSQTAQTGLWQDAATVAFEVERVFFEGLRGRELLEVAEARLRRAQEGLEAAKRKETAGTGTRSDTLRAELELNTARQAQLQARTQRETAAYALGRVVGAEGAVDAVEDAESAAEAEVNVNAFIASLREQSPDIAAAEASVRSAQAGVQVARSAYLPSMSVGGGVDWGGSVGGTLPPGAGGWSLQLRLSYDLFDGFQRDEALERARVQEQVAAAALADTRRAVFAGAQQLAGQLALAREQIALAETSVKVAEEDLRVQQERYQLGVTTMLDLLRSQEAVADAQQQRVAARFDYRLARAELMSLQGRRP